MNIYLYVYNLWCLMINIFEKIDYNKISDNIYAFFVQYKNILFISFFVAVFVNAVDIFTIKFGIDAEQFAVDKSNGYTSQQRYGSLILYYLFPFARYHILSQITGLIALIFAALLTISRHNISNNSKLLFVLLFITYPNFAFIQYFYFQSAYNFIGLLLVVIAYRMTENNKNILLHIIAVFFLFIGISSYQTNMAVFLCVMMINVILDFINNRNYKQATYSIIKATIILLLSLILFYTVIKLSTSQLNSYHNNMIKYSNDVIGGVINLAVYLRDVLFSIGYNGSHTANIIITCILTISIIYLIYKIIKIRDIKYNIFFISLMFLFLLAVFSMDIITGGYLQIRIEYAFAFYPAFILFLIFIYSRNKLIQTGIIIFSFGIILFHASQIVKIQTAHYITYKQDITIAENIINKLYNKYPDVYHGKYKVAFKGGIKNHDYPLSIEGKEMFSLSYFQLFFANYKMLLFLKLVGLPYNIQQGTITEDMKKEIEKMPVYPNNDCIKLIGDTIIIKLNNN